MSSSMSHRRGQPCWKEATIDVRDPTDEDEEVQDLKENALLGHNSMEIVFPESKKEGVPELTYNLLTEADSIRYIVLEPGSSVEPLICSLHTVSLGNAPASSFEAISYVWGDPKRCRQLLCDAKQLMITRNLEAALRQVRLPEKPRKLWVDFVCINQGDKKEQGRQVGLMGRIYSQALCTLICLGPESRGDAPVAMNIVHETSTRVEHQLRDLEWHKANERSMELPFPGKDDLVLHDPRWKSVRALIEHAWFERTWVVQEAALAKDARVLWGSSEIDWVEVLRVLYWLRMRGASIRGRFDIALAAIHRRTFASKRPSEAALMVAPANLEAAKPLGAILYSARSLRTSDLRDKIYAFLSMPTSTIALTSIEPTYEVEYQVVYHTFACSYLRETGDLDLLQYVEHRKDDDLGTLVSWVPRWDILETKMGIPRYRKLNRVETLAAQQKDHTFPNTVFALLDGDKVLKLRAILIDLNKDYLDNADFWKTGYGGLDENKIVRFWGRLAPKRSPMDSHSESVSESAAQSFLSTLMMGDSGSRAQLSANPAEWDAARIRWLQHLHRGEPATSGWELPTGIKKELDRAHRGRRFAVLSRGNYCLVPAIATADDVCAIVVGAMLPPLILRATSSTSGYYKVIGPAYVSGASNEGGGFCSHQIGGCEACWTWSQRLGDSEDIFLC